MPMASHKQYVASTNKLFHILHHTVEPQLSNPLGPGEVHKSDKFVSLKLCIKNIFKISVLSTTLIEQSLL